MDEFALSEQATHVSFLSNYSKHQINFSVSEIQNIIQLG